MRKWAKILPYFVVMWFTKKFGANTESFNDDKIKAWRIDKGEWVVWNQDNYDRMRENEKKQKQTKLDKKKARIDKMLRRNYDLKQALKEDIEQEIENEKEEFENY